MNNGTRRKKGSGLLSKKDSKGKALWYVRLYHEGKERRFRSFKNKTEARDFYEKAKQERSKAASFLNAISTAGRNWRQR